MSKWICFTDHRFLQLFVQCPQGSHDLFSYGGGGETVIIQCDTYYIGSALRGLEKKDVWLILGVGDFVMEELPI